MKILIKKSLWRQRWYFIIVASNGKTVATSENYANRLDMLETIMLLQAKMGSARVIEFAPLEED